MSRLRGIRQLSTDALFAPEQPQPSPPRSPWQTVASLVTALAVIFSVVTQAKGNPVLALAMVAVALLVAGSVFYRPIVGFVRRRIQQARRNRVARKLWSEVLRFEKRFGSFIGHDDPTNLRNILSELCNRSDTELAKLCPPHYLTDFYALFSSRHQQRKAKDEVDFSLALAELRGMVCSYNSDYVLEPLKRLKSEQRLAQLPPYLREHGESSIEDFRERWVEFLADFKKFLDKANSDFRYDSYEAFSTYFERPKKL